MSEREEKRATVTNYTVVGWLDYLKGDTWDTRVQRGKSVEEVERKIIGWLEDNTTVSEAIVTMYHIGELYSMKRASWVRDTPVVIKQDEIKGLEI